MILPITKPTETEVRYITVNELTGLSEAMDQAKKIVELIGRGWAIASAVATQNTVHYILTREVEK